jgi:hypothetical protein
MGKIKKELKNSTFIYDEESKTFTLYNRDGLSGTIELNKIYAFAFMRFVVRMAQRNWLRPNKKQKKDIEEIQEEFEQENKNQLKLFENE